MRFIILIVLILFPINAFAQNSVVDSAATSEEKPVLIKNILMEGFVLQDKNQFVKLFKPYRNKYLKTADMDGILHKIQGIYEQEGYQQLVSISYKVEKHRLVFTALMTS